MCRNIKTLFNFDPPALVARRLVDSLVTNTPPRDRSTEAAKARARAVERFGRPGAVAVMNLEWHR